MAKYHDNKTLIYYLYLAIYYYLLFIINYYLYLAFLPE